MSCLHREKRPTHKKRILRKALEATGPNRRWRGATPRAPALGFGAATLPPQPIGSNLTDRAPPPLRMNLNHAIKVSLI